VESGGGQDEKSGQRLASVLRGVEDARVPTEMYLYADDGHAFGRRRTRDPITEWPQLVEKWLRTIGAVSQ